MVYKIKESQLRGIIAECLKNMMLESEEDIEDVEIEDNWNAPDEFDTPEEEPTEISDDDIVLEPEEKPEDKTKADLKRERVAALFRNILSKQGYSGERLEREIEKRLGSASTKTDAATRRSDRSFDAYDEPVTMNGQNMGYMASGGIYDDDNVLYESVRKVIAEGLKKVLK